MDLSRSARARVLSASRSRAARASSARLCASVAPRKAAARKGDGGDAGPLEGDGTEVAPAGDVTTSGERAPLAPFAPLAPAPRGLREAIGAAACRARRPAKRRDAGAARLLGQQLED